MKHPSIKDISPLDLHRAMFDNGFTLMMILDRCEHWTRRDRAVIVEYDRDVSGEAVEDLEPVEIRFAHLAQLNSGEILVL